MRAKSRFIGEAAPATLTTPQAELLGALQHSFVWEDEARHSVARARLLRYGAMRALRDAGLSVNALARVTGQSATSVIRFLEDAGRDEAARPLLQSMLDRIRAERAAPATGGLKRADYPSPGTRDRRTGGRR